MDRVVGEKEKVRKSIFLILNQPKPLVPSIEGKIGDDAKQQVYICCANKQHPNKGAPFRRIGKAALWWR
jgi:hypothetical protein